MHSLTKSAIFFAVGHIAQVKGTQKIADMGGLTATHPRARLGLVLGVVAIAGLPPLGIFMSEFLIVSSTFAREPLLAIPLVLGLLIAFGALFLRLNRIAFGEPKGPNAQGERPPTCRCSLHLGLVLVAGIYLPAAAGRLVPERGEAARIERATMAAHRHRQRPAARRQAHRPWPRVVVGERRLAACHRSELVDGARHAAWAVGRHGRRALALLEEPSDASPCSPCNAPTASFPRSARMHPPAIRLERAIRDLYGLNPTGADDTRPWLDHGLWGVRIRSATARSAPSSLRLTRSCPSKARACTRSRSARCMPASSSPGISASPPTARRWCGSKSGSAMCTRASRG